MTDRFRACLFLIPFVPFVAASACGGSSSNPEPDASSPVPDASSSADASTLEPPTNPIMTPSGDWHACSASDESDATVVAAHATSHHYNATRNIDAQVQLPEGPFQQIFMRVELGCPDGRCDIWDRGASIALIEDEGDAMKRIELARYMTPYGRGFCFMADVTDLATHLSGKKTIRSFIDTWVGPDDNQNGHGWTVTTKFIFRAGTPDTTAYASEIIPLWNNQAEDRLITIGDPAKLLDAELPRRTVAIPADARKVKLRYLITGHGQGGGGNCAEFCQLFYRTFVGATHVDVLPWRPNCNVNPVSPQNGTWPYPRAGWCPGAFVEPLVVDITDQVTPGTDATFDFTVVDETGAEFVNTCRPGAGNAQNVCEGCTSDPGGADNCDYNYNGHTQPEARISVQMLVYR